MGVSRSTTIVLAYLLWFSRQPNATSTPKSDSPSTASSTSLPEMVSLPRSPWTVDTALSLVRKSRPQVEPNSGFIKQLRMYEAMNCPTTQEELESHKIYRRWMNSREVMDALSDNRAPTMQHISFRDEENDDDDEVEEKIGPGLTDAVASLDLSNPEDDSPTEIINPDIALSSPSPAPSPPANLEIKCRKCRRLLAKSTFILPHKPPPHRDPSAKSVASSGAGGDPCAHIFLHPLSWMRPTLSQGELDGRLTCPTTWCGANVGKFAWQGLRCSCGGWVTPGFGLAKGKVDEVRVRPNDPDSWSLPPGMRKGGSNGHL